MLTRILISTIFLFAALLLPAFCAAQPAEPPEAPATQPANEPDEAAAKANLAERLVGVGQDLLPPPQQEISAPLAAQSAALLQASARLNPNEARYPRLLADADAALADSKGEIDAWTA